MFSLPASIRRRTNGHAGVARQAPVVRWGIGHDPGRVSARAGRPVAIVFERLDSHCATECVAFPALGRVAMLRVRTRVVLDPCPVGEYVFRSRGGELEGVLVVQP
jgi:hypothetical protein